MNQPRRLVLVRSTRTPEPAPAPAAPARRGGALPAAILPLIDALAEIAVQDYLQENHSSGNDLAGQGENPVVPHLR